MLNRIVHRSTFPFLLAILAAACADTATPPTSPMSPNAAAPQFIIGGTPTGAGSFGNVGAVLADFNGDGRIQPFDEWYCSGSLISQTVFLTAAHCLQFLPAGTQVYVSFSPDLGAKRVRLIAGTSFHYDPLYGASQSNPHDIGVIILNARDTRGITPLQLPPAGYLDALNADGGLKGVFILNVGYGGDATRTGQPAFTYDGVRKVSKSLFQNLEPSWLLINMNVSKTGEGGACYGDSGSPKFIEGNTTMAVAIVITGDAVCRATDKDYRLDTQSAREFLSQFVRLP
jgi:V8-like Glu-specific endopeptidase